MLKRSAGIIFMDTCCQERGESKPEQRVVKNILCFAKRALNIITIAAFVTVPTVGYGVRLAWAVPSPGGSGQQTCQMIDGKLVCPGQSKSGIRLADGMESQNDDRQGGGCPGGSCSGGGGGGAMGGGGGLGGGLGGALGGMMGQMGQLLPLLMMMMIMNQNKTPAPTPATIVITATPVPQAAGTATATPVSGFRF